MLENRLLRLCHVTSGLLCAFKDARKLFKSLEHPKNQRSNKGNEQELHELPPVT